MAVTNQTLLEALNRLQSRVDELAAAIALLCERAAGLETWRNSHETGEHMHLREQVKTAQRIQERQGERLWKVALQVANLAALLAAVSKMMGAW